MHLFSPSGYNTAIFYFFYIYFILFLYKGSLVAILKKIFNHPLFAICITFSSFCNRNNIFIIYNIFIVYRSNMQFNHEIIFFIKPKPLPLKSDINGF